jgi:hypothetical protein
MADQRVKLSSVLCSPTRILIFLHLSQSLTLNPLLILIYETPNLTLTLYTLTPTPNPIQNPSLNRISNPNPNSNPTKQRNLEEMAGQGAMLS